jgi:hypothetical protein
MLRIGSIDSVSLNFRILDAEFNNCILFCWESLNLCDQGFFGWSSAYKISMKSELQSLVLDPFSVLSQYCFISYLVCSLKSSILKRHPSSLSKYFYFLSTFSSPKLINSLTTFPFRNDDEWDTYLFTSDIFSLNI